mmetsp:Transcript_138726/g.431543  ORF Transcript_138726/g.431543 Transcript_138726/m.431543 type:complete len:247 (+) Transcript_138726:304-1044(+)
MASRGTPPNQSRVMLSVEKWSADTSPRPRLATSPLMAIRATASPSGPVSTRRSMNCSEPRPKAEPWSRSSLVPRSCTSSPSGSQNCFATPLYIVSGSSPTKPAAPGGVQVVVWVVRVEVVAVNVDTVNVVEVVMLVVEVVVVVNVLELPVNVEVEAVEVVAVRVLVDVVSVVMVDVEVVTVEVEVVTVVTVTVEVVEVVVVTVTVVVSVVVVVVVAFPRQMYLSNPEDWPLVAVVLLKRMRPAPGL